MSQLFEDLIFHGREERNIEYKQTMSWNDSKTQEKVIKTSIAMSNIRDGGYIIFGVELQGSDYIPQGMSKENYDSFDQDDVQVKVNEYADPYVCLKVHKPEIKQKLFIIIEVSEFAELPNVCRKSGNNLKRGDVYIRPYYKHESTNIFSETDMRDLLNLALNKMLLKSKADFIKLCPYTESVTAKVDEEKYQEQIKGLGQ